MRYLRTYSRIAQVSIFLFLVFAFFLIVSLLLSGVVTKMFDISLEQLSSLSASTPMRLITISVWVQAVSSLMLFAVPALLFAYLYHPRASEFLGLSGNIKIGKLLLVLLIILGITPMLQLIEGLISNIDFGASIKQSQKENDDTMAAFLNMPYISYLFRAVLVMAIIPGLGEELFFRGVMMRITHRSMRNFRFSILMTGVIFAMAHSNICGFVSIFLAGSLLGYIYYLTGNLWYNIIAHAFFNSLQIILEYLQTRNPGLKQFMEHASPMLWVAVALAGLGIAFFAWRRLLQVSTPLPHDWPRDFSDSELEALAENPINF